MNAIILVAGMGTRISEISKDSHKALLPIDNKPNIERTIEYLKEYGVNDIVLVTGHNGHLFEYLKDKYGCKLIYNEHYKDYNNMYSFYKAYEFFGDSLVIDGDVVFFKNIFVNSDTSLYYTTLRDKGNKGEWIPITDENAEVKRIDVGVENRPSMLGVSFWTALDAKLIKEELKNHLTEEYLNNPKLYWDDIPRKLLGKIKVKTHFVDSKYVAEIDTSSDYKFIKKTIEKQ
ncbi:MAG: NTP transferase domain-containing protein [Clostridia bacterium]|nr:NTP transferase domain-containing protein [Clostridia bacterium]